MSTYVSRYPTIPLPPEIIVRIFAMVGPADLCVLRRVCSTWRDLVDEEIIWISRAKEDYNISILSSSEISSKSIYQKLLCPYGHLTGVWQRTNLNLYGELMEVRYDQETAAIEFENLRPGHDVYQDLTRQKFLTITPTSLKNHDFLTCNEEVVLKCKEEGYQLVVAIPSLKDMASSPKEWRELLEEFRKTDSTRKTEGAVMKFVSVYHNRALYVYKRVLTPEWSLDLHNKFTSGCPILSEIPAGVFKGDYGGNGIHLVHLRDGQGVKLTGDPNVPFNQVTFRTTSPVRMNLSLETQRSLRLVMEATASHSSQTPGPAADRYKFVVPDGVTQRPLITWKECMGRWAAEAQIASHMFRDPKFIPANLIVFSEDQFAVMFLDLKSISMFHRVNVGNMGCVE